MNIVNVTDSCKNVERFNTVMLLYIAFIHSKNCEKIKLQATDIYKIYRYGVNFVYLSTGT